MEELNYWGLIPLGLIIVVVIYILMIKPPRKNMDLFSQLKSEEIEEDKQVKNVKEKIFDNKKIIIPNVCPHCKSPNTKKLQECEWCGNEIY